MRQRGTVIESGCFNPIPRDVTWCASLGRRPQLIQGSCRMNSSQSGDFIQSSYLGMASPNLYLYGIDPNPPRLLTANPLYTTVAIVDSYPVGNTVAHRLKRTR